MKLRGGSAFWPIRMPTGLPSMVPDEPTFVPITAMMRNGIGRIFSVSQTWKIRVATKTIEVTSSTMQDMNAPRKTIMATKKVPVIPLSPMTLWMIQVNRPSSLSTPTVTIMPIRNRITSSWHSSMKVGSVSTFVPMSAPIPTKAMASRDFQNSSVDMMMMMKMETEITCWRSSPNVWPSSATRPLMISVMRGRTARRNIPLLGSPNAMATPAESCSEMSPMRRRRAASCR